MNPANFVHKEMAYFFQCIATMISLVVEDIRKQYVDLNHVAKSSGPDS